MATKVTSPDRLRDHLAFHSQLENRPVGREQHVRRDACVGGDRPRVPTLLVERARGVGGRLRAEIRHRNQNQTLGRALDQVIKSL